MTNRTDKLRDLFMALHEELVPNLSVEAGAWRAEFSQDVKTRLPKTRAWAFEANKHNYDENVSSLVAKGVGYVNMAVTNKVGSTRFLMQEMRRSDGATYSKIRGNNSLLARNDDDVLYSAPKVTCTTLDAFFVDDYRIKEDERATLWIDVEGASREVLTGGVAFLTYVDAILIEVEEIPYWDEQWLDTDVDKFLVEQGFTKIARDSEYEHQYNVVYLRNDKVLELKDIWTNWLN